jgi:phage N-6-adenine-methyltransferase
MTRKMPAQRPGRSQQTVGTPREFIAAVEKRWSALSVDLAASPGNAKAPLAIYEDERDSLTVPWGDEYPDMLHWLNPPFDNIAAFAEKCAREGELMFSRRRGERIFFLVPASVGANWWAEWVHPSARIKLLSPRLTFEGHTQPYPKDCALCIFGDEPLEPHYEPWRWKP